MYLDPQQQALADNYRNQQQQAQATNGSAPGTPGSYTGGTNSLGYGGAGEIAGGNAVNLRGINMPYFQQDRDRLGGMLQGQSPFASGDWNDVISQLKMRASGQGDSLAAMNYKQNLGDANNAMAGMAHGGARPGAFRAAAEQMGQSTQGQALGASMAKTNEMNQAQGSLTQALGARDQLNQSAYLNMLAQQLGLSEEQLKALQGDQTYNQAQNQTDQQRHAAAANAVAGMLGGAAKMGG